MNDVKAEPLTPGGNRMMQRRYAGAVLIAGGAIFFLAEFIAAAAWTNPPYSYTHHYISNLGVRGPSEAFGQFMYSPLAWVMNTGFFLFGITLFVGAAMLRGLHGRRRWAVLTPAALLAVGGVLLAFFPGSGETAHAAIDYHALGAFAGIVGGNVLIIILGRLRRDVDITAKTGKAMVVLGVFGLVALVGFLALAGSGTNVLIGLVERCAVYPLLIGLIGAGASIWNRNTPEHGSSTTPSTRSA
ncbi:DUF998 domain-containing protein [Nonomuraea endophytica]|uniref:Putative membrane protein n=1 Tax=Nonomuraea endophytica TaxID=714136 RepID=A0A7W8A5Q9_9ACTN|nr:DUF998 domain-containing protein [Nonomuraea endophytica]MBB5079504.1 putative membrane protein [Nonomuraea endophytica]